jgi:hypothetical protein
MFPVVQESMVAVSSAQVRRQSKSDAHKGATLRGSHHPASGARKTPFRGACGLFRGLAEGLWAGVRPPTPPRQRYSKPKNPSIGRRKESGC